MRPIRSSAFPSPTRARARRLLLGALHRAGALLGLLLVLPVLVAIALAVRATSPGPVFSRRERVGGNGHVVGLLRFRTATLPDGVVTPVGRFLHRYGLDELPRLLNVLRGDASLMWRRTPLPGDGERPGATNPVVRALRGDAAQ